MTAGNATSLPEDPSTIFSAILKPHRSLSPSGFLALMAALIACSFTAGLAFWMMGAWPVVGFFGLDIALVQLAFRLNYRAARASEEIRVTREQLLVRQTTPSGRTAEADFNPYWARLEIDRHPEFGVTGLRIASHGRQLAIARFLGPRERQSFADALTRALAEARATPAT